MFVTLRMKPSSEIHRHSLIFSINDDKGTKQEEKENVPPNAPGAKPKTDARIETAEKVEKTT